MTAENEVMGDIEDKNGLLKDLSRASKEGLDDDLTLICSDGVRISANKSILAIRSPFFASMLLGGFQDSIGDELEFNSCDSVVLKLVLDYIWNGEVYFSNLPTVKLLEVMETSRFLCLNSLSDGVEGYISKIVDEGNVSRADSLVLLNFVTFHKFEHLGKRIVKYIDHHFDELKDLPTFQQLTELAMLSLLKNDEREISEMCLFEGMLKWMEGRDELNDDFKQVLIESCKLNKFTSAFLLTIVRKTELFRDEVIFDILEERVKSIEHAVVDANTKLDHMENDMNYLHSNIHQMEMKCNQDKKDADNKIRELQGKIDAIDLKWKNADINLRTCAEIVERSPEPNYDFSTSPLRNYLGASTGIVFKFKNWQFLNKVQFTLMHTVKTNYSCSYKLESSMDGITWATFMDVSGADCEGRQTIFFEKRTMQFLCIRLKIDDVFSKCFIKIDERDVVLMLDTISGERKNTGQVFW